jgi:hypothetical protein
VHLLETFICNFAEPSKKPTLQSPWKGIVIVQVIAFDLPIKKLLTQFVHNLLDSHPFGTTFTGEFVTKLPPV